MARRPFAHSRAPRRATSWLDLPAAVTILTSGGGTIVLSLTAAELAKRPFTIVRTHIELLFSSDQLTADEGQIGAVGMCVVSDQAEAIGVTAVPTPVTDLSSDLWFVHRSMINEFAFITAAGFDGNGGSHYTVDSKAMRKVNDDQDVLMVVEIDGSLSNGASIRSMGRVLIKEH